MDAEKVVILQIKKTTMASKTDKIIEIHIDDLVYDKNGHEEDDGKGMFVLSAHQSFCTLMTALKSSKSMASPSGLPRMMEFANTCAAMFSLKVSSTALVSGVSVITTLKPKAVTSVITSLLMSLSKTDLMPF